MLGKFSVGFITYDHVIPRSLSIGFSLVFLHGVSFLPGFSLQGMVSIFF